MDGNITQLEILSQNEFATTNPDFVRTQLVFTSTNGTVKQMGVDDNGGSTSPFFGTARAYCDGDYWDNTVFSMVQTAGMWSNVGTFQFYMVMPPNPGKSWLVPTVCPGDTFTFSGNVIWSGEPPGARVMPQLGSYKGATGPADERVVCFHAQ
jgi:hypothetical protein